MTQSSDPIRYAVRLHPEQMAILTKGMPISGCPKNELEAGFMAGIQHVLTKLRDGFVIGEA